MNSKITRFFSRKTPNRINFFAWDWGKLHPTVSEVFMPDLVARLRENHYTIVRELDLGDNSLIMNKLNDIFEELDELLSGPHSGNFDYDYDRVVSFGEILSTTLISTYLNLKGIKNEWADARLLIRTDHNYREGKVDWDESARLIQEKVGKILSDGVANIVVSQGFIGGTEEMLPTTLGREGSDYSAAIFAYVLNAESVTIWKDVPGLLNADPKFFPEAVKLEQISYEEAIELAYYGASVIHSIIRHSKIACWHIRNSDRTSFVHNSILWAYITSTIRCFM